MKIEQLFYDPGNAVNLIAYDIDVFSRLVILAAGTAQQLNVIVDDTERVVNFMSDLGRHFAQRRQPLCLQQLLLGSTQQETQLLLAFIEAGVFNGN